MTSKIISKDDKDIVITSTTFPFFQFIPTVEELTGAAVLVVVVEVVVAAALTWPLLLLPINKYIEYTYKMI
jgi:hypothetical protein